MVEVELEVVVVSLLRCRSRQRPIRDSKSNEVDLQEVEVLLVRQLVVELSVEVVVDVRSCAKVKLFRQRWYLMVDGRAGFERSKESLQIFVSFIIRFNNSNRHSP